MPGPPGTSPPARLVVIGTILQTPTPHRLEVAADVAVVVADDGTITAVVPATSDEAAAAIQASAEVVRLSPQQRLLPGLVDLHLHAPQWPLCGAGLDLPLEEWLLKYAFPLEARCSDVAFAREVWEDLVACLLRHGTTSAVYLSSIHEAATLCLAETCVRLGQRALVGRVAMDHPDLTPAWYRDADAAAAVAASERSIHAIRALQSPLVQPILTPRFIPACSDTVLEGLGRLAEQYEVPVQTHCSESDWEHSHVLARCGISDAAMLHRCGLLRRGTVLAHGTHLSDDDLQLIRAAGAGVAHCPLSNSYFAGATLPVARLMAAGVPLGLGSDVAGGYCPRLLSQAAATVTASCVLQSGLRPDDGGESDSRVDVVRAFFLATVGGAELLGLPVGWLAPGGRSTPSSWTSGSGGAPCGRGRGWTRRRWCLRRLSAWRPAPK